MKKYIILIISIIILFVTINFFKINTDSIYEDKKTEFGVILPLTGSASQYGIWALQGIELAKDEENFNIKIQDEKCQGNDAVNSYNKLKTEGIDLFLGPLCNAASIPLLKIAENDRSILFTLGISTKTIRETGNYSFTILPPSEMQTKKLSDYLIKNNISKVSLIYIKNEYGEENKATFIKAYSNNTLINLESFNPSETDFHTILTKIKNDKSNALIIIGYSPNYISIIKQIKELGINKKLFAVSTIQDPGIINSTANLSEGIIYTYPSLKDSKKQKEFLEKYNKKYKQNYSDIPIYVGAGYDAAKILSFTQKKCKDNQCIKNEILKIKDFSGINGLINIDENGNSIIEIELKKIKNNRFIKIIE